MNARMILMALCSLLFCACASKQVINNTNLKENNTQIRKMAEPDLENIRWEYTEDSDLPENLKGKFK